jgi:protein with von Willebrand factor-like domain
MFQTVRIGGVAASRGTPRIPASGIRKRSAKFNTEEYDHFEEKDFAEARRSPLSTFGADVDTASYSNVRRFLHQRKLPPAGSCCGNRDLAVRQASIT